MIIKSLVLPLATFSSVKSVFLCYITVSQWVCVLSPRSCVRWDAIRYPSFGIGKLEAMIPRSCISNFYDKEVALMSQQGLKS